MERLMPVEIYRMSTKFQGVQIFVGFVVTCHPQKDKCLSIHVALHPYHLYS